MVEDGSAAAAMSFADLQGQDLRMESLILLGT